MRDRIAFLMFGAGALAAFYACGSADSKPSEFAVDGGGGGAGDGAVAVHDEGDASGFADARVPTSDAGGDAGKLLIYGSSDTTLYSLDPANNTVTTVGNFDCVPDQTSAMTDIAVNAQNEIWGVSAKAVWRLEVDVAGAGAPSPAPPSPPPPPPDAGGPAGDAGSAPSSLPPVRCSRKVPLQNPSVRFYGLTFAPIGVLSASEEVLVAANTAGEVWAIASDGTLSQHGTLGVVPATDGRGHAYDSSTVGKPWELSGDLVFLSSGGSPIGFATARDCPSPPDTKGCNGTDTLLEIDLAKLSAQGTQPVVKAVRGFMKQSAGCSNGTAYGRFYGIAAWGSKIYGFSRYGSLVSVESATGEGCNLPGPPGVSWSGAGVNTLAPVIPPSPH